MFRTLVRYPLAGIRYSKLWNYYVASFTTTTVISQAHESNTPYFVTTPIFYVNSAPHIGHLYSALIADASTRWHQMNGRAVVFSTGTDEHGLKIQQAALSQNVSPEILCDNVSRKFKQLFDKADIKYSDFVRTTEERHKTAVRDLWNNLQRNGVIYKGIYKGWYSTSDEAFLTDAQVTETKDKAGNVIRVSTESGHPVEWMEEDNFMFKLSAFRNKLKFWVDQSSIRPSNYVPMVYQWIDELQDLSVSRSTSRLRWGIRVPGSDDQTMYVWIDALTNYLTVGGFPKKDHLWPADCHVVGKDILKFHAIYWPALLMAAGLEPPKLIHCHAHWLLNDEKISKSKGNVVDPMESMKKYTVDGLRYFLLRAGVPHSDGNYFDQKVMECLNSEIGNTLGNLLSRCTGKAVNPSQTFPVVEDHALQRNFNDDDISMWNQLNVLPSLVADHYQDMNFYKVADTIMQMLRDANAFVQRKEPWELCKDPSRSDDLQCVIFVALESLRVASILLQPMIPTLSKMVLDRLNVDVDCRMFENSKIRSKVSIPLGQSRGVLFKRIK